MKRATVILGLLLALSTSVAGSARAADATPAATVRMQELDAAILTRLNVTRASHGLHPLVLSEQLENAAVAHSREMLDGGFFAHDSPDGISFVQRLKHYFSPNGYGSWSAGENIIYNTAEMDAATAIEMWLESPPHRDNMLDPGWREVGIGSVHAASAGGTFGGDPTWVITMDFGTRTAPGTAAKPAATTEALSVQTTVAKKSEKQMRPHTTRATPKPRATNAKPAKPKMAKPHAPHVKKQPTPKPRGPAKKETTGQTLPVPMQPATAPTVPDPAAAPGDGTDPAGDELDPTTRYHHGGDGPDDDGHVDADAGLGVASEPPPAP